MSEIKALLSIYRKTIVFTNRLCAISQSNKNQEKVAFVICDECGDSFPNKKALLRHSRKHIEQEESRFECDECSKVSLLCIDSLTAHLLCIM